MEGNARHACLYLPIKIVKKIASLRRADKSKKEKSKDPKPSHHRQPKQHGIRSCPFDDVDSR
jgi:hypothetical protein